MAEGVDMARIEAGGISPLPQRERHGLSKTAKIVGSAILGGSAIIGGAFGINKLRQADETPVVPPVATVPAAVIPTEGPQLVTPMPSPTPEVTQAPNVNPDAKFPPATLTPEVKQEVPCLILAPELCSQAERVPIIIEGKEYIYLGFKDLPPGTPVYFPNDGFFSVDKETEPQFSGFNIFVRKATGGGTEIRGVLDIDNIIQRDVEAGEIAGHTLDGKTLEGEYSLLFTITKRSPEGPVTDEDALRQIAPLAFEKPLAESTQNIEDSGSSATFKLPPGAEPAR